MFGRNSVGQAPAAGWRWSMSESYPLPVEVYVQLRAEQVRLNEVVSILRRCRELGIKIVAQLTGGKVCRLWALPGEPTDFVECDSRAARPVADGLERLLVAVARAR